MPSAQPTQIRMRTARRITDGTTSRLLDAGVRVRIDADKVGWAGFISPSAARELVEKGLAIYETVPANPAEAHPSPVKASPAAASAPIAPKAKAPARSELMTGARGGLGK